MWLHSVIRTFPTRVNQCIVQTLEMAKNWVIHCFCLCCVVCVGRTKIHPKALVENGSFGNLIQAPRSNWFICQMGESLIKSYELLPMVFKDLKVVTWFQDPCQVLVLEWVFLHPCQNLVLLLLERGWWVLKVNFYMVCPSPLTHKQPHRWSSMWIWWTSEPWKSVLSGVTVERNQRRIRTTTCIPLFATNEFYLIVGGERERKKKKTLCSGAASVYCFLPVNSQPQGLFFPPSALPELKHPVGTTWMVSFSLISG